MKFITSSIDLLKNLQAISGVLSTSNSLPILENFLFEIKNKELILSASDLETTMITRMQVESKENGSICIPARILLDTLKTFPSVPLTFTIDEKSFGIEISSDFGKYKLTGFNAVEFPRIPQLDGASNVAITSEILSRALNKTIFASGNDELRPVMSGVYVQLSDENVTFAATDAHKLVRYRRSDCKSERAASFILPKKAINLLRSQLATTSAVVTVEYNTTNALFSYDDTQLVCRLIDGKYPNYEAVIPKQNPNKLTVERASILGSLKRVSIFANKTTHQVRLKIAGSELSISAEDLDFANAASERLTCSYEGEDMEIGFNSRFLIEMLNNLESKDILIEMSAPNRAGIISPTEYDNTNENVLMLVMPVMLNS